MRESLAFENAALEVFNLIDQVMESLENVDNAIEDLERAGEAHGRIQGFKAEYFKVGSNRELGVKPPTGLLIVSNCNDRLFKYVHV